MFCPHKNSYLQLKCAMDPRVINKAVRRAMRKKQIDPHDELPAAQRLESMQPSLYAPCVDITRAQLGFGRIGLRKLNRDLAAEDNLLQLQAVHTLLDQAYISENALFLIELNVIYRLIDLMPNRDPMMREKVLLILVTFANYYQGRQRILSRAKIFVERLIHLFMRDRKEIRYAAALLLKTLTRDRCACEVILKNDEIVENLLKVIKNDYTGIVILHLNSLKNLVEWDPVRPLKANAFQIMLKLMVYDDGVFSASNQYRVVAAAMDCMAQLCKHSVGKKLADKYDMNKVLQPFLLSPEIEVITSAVGLMSYTTLTKKSKWRVKEFAYDLNTLLITLADCQTVPALQLRAMQVLINLCDSPDIREEIKGSRKKEINGSGEKKCTKINIRTHEQWDGTSPTTTFELETGHNYRTMCIENVETIKNDYGDNANAINVHSYMGRVEHVKDHLLKAIRFRPEIN